MYGLTLIADATAEPLTIGEAKDHLRATSSDDEGLIAGYIMAARRHLESITNRAFATKTFSLTLDAFPYGPYTVGYSPRTQADSYPFGLYAAGQAIRLPRGPVQSVASITYYDTNGDQQTVDPARYQLDASRSPARVTPAFGSTWPTAQLRISGIVLTFVAGYTVDTFPDDLRMAMLLLIGHWYQNREAVNTDSRFATLLPLGVAELIADHRIVWLA